MPRGKKTDPQLRNLIVRLRDDEGYTFQQLAEHMKMDKSTIRRIYCREKNPLVVGESRATKKN